MKTHTLLHDIEPTPREKMIIMKVLKYISRQNSIDSINIEDINSRLDSTKVNDKSINRLIQDSNDYDELKSKLKGCDSVECLLGNCILHFHIEPMSLLMLTTAIHSRTKQLDTSTTWYDNYTLNNYLFQLGTIVYKRFDDQSDSSVKSVPDVSDELKIKSNVTFEDSTSERYDYNKLKSILHLLFNEYNVFEQIGMTTDDKNFNQKYKTKSDLVKIMDSIILRHPYISGGTHGCDVFWIQSKSVSIHTLMILCKRYPLTTFGYILNTMSYQSGRGQHWMSVLFKTGVCYLICSVGGDFNSFELKDQINNELFNQGFSRQWNVKRIQDDHSSCGMYSVLSTLSFIIEVYTLTESIESNVNLNNVVDRIGIGATKINSSGIDAIKKLITGFKSE